MENVDRFVRNDFWFNTGTETFSGRGGDRDVEIKFRVPRYDAKLSELWSINRGGLSIRDGCSHDVRHRVGRYTVC